MKSRVCSWILAGTQPRMAVLLLAFALTALAQQSSVRTDIEVVPVRGNIYLLSGAGANITASVGPEGVLIVDSGRAEMSDKVLAAIQRLNHDLSVGGKPLASSKPVNVLVMEPISKSESGLAAP